MEEPSTVSQLLGFAMLGGATWGAYTIHKLIWGVPDGDE